VCEQLTAAGLTPLVAALSAAPEVPVHAHVDGELVMGAAQRALARAGYSLEEFQN
jgi:hypothetical protein